MTIDGTLEFPDREEFYKDVIASTISAWVDSAYLRTLHGVNSKTTPNTALEEMRWMYLSPHQVAGDIYDILRIAGAFGE